MTTEEKAKAYEMALELAKKIYNESAGSCCDTANATVKVLEGLFPQLKESEDERLANQLINLVQSAGEVLLVPTNKEELIGWIKKCKESLHISETCKENADSFTDGEDERIRKAIIELLKEVGRDDTGISENAKCMIAWLERQKKQERWRVGENAYFTPEQKPAEWSEKYIADIFEKVGLARIVREQGNDELTNAVQSAMIELSKGYKQEWSEEDERILKGIIGKIDHDQSYGVSKKDMLDFLNDIRIRRGNIICVDADRIQEYLPRLTWKPSDEQMEALHKAIKKAYHDYDARPLEFLYTDLLKLK